MFNATHISMVAVSNIERAQAVTVAGSLACDVATSGTIVIGFAGHHANAGEQVLVNLIAPCVEAKLAEAAFAGATLFAGVSGTLDYDGVDQNLIMFVPLKDGGSGAFVPVIAVGYITPA